ncbi:nuclear transport factor 2 family protein [Kaistella sp. BT6-1-3]|uniref:Nuclear transport factor 2 family protein n=1 Tax=Kaistella yananensis TaxID=2989820 RepID=A0ABT3JJU9_9FLAO|nr:nuclear transport factor 2 family protein [Kaistella yananensis]MCW4451052.1 nuclear transport factor 2 family protein [Kaistella yananensis]
MKTLNFITVLLLFFTFSVTLSAQNKGFYENVQKKNISKVLDDLNTFAATADYKNYFDLYAEESTFIGTDATEVWNKKEFMAWAKPFFDKGKAWNFTSLKRSITFSKDGNYAWFDEVLDTQMKICRGSGVLEKIGGKWKIRQYVLSTTVPNEVIDEVVKIKTPIEDALISELKKN